ncbi:hypothetical protein SAMN04487895_11771 [Paenibacillus sophorae]|uniref:Transposase DDE domain-containing protein n=1 Tax=Paenibacillus sophorae TaxID=1333845 RepID=A0A1H8UER3_9BACL|nr:hypothetical protein SAMN04487895_11771 [Paenibacillus sophorae]
MEVMQLLIVQRFQLMRKTTKLITDPTGHPNWGTKFYSFPLGNKVKWFGDKLHLAVDTCHKNSIKIINNF